VCVGAGRRHEVIVADELADPRPRHPAQVEQGDTTVAKVVRTERRDASGRAGTRESGAETIAAEAMEDGLLRNSVLARHKRRHGLEEHVGYRNPPGASGLRYCT
jgi:hypothetical protein